MNINASKKQFLEKFQRFLTGIFLLICLVAGNGGYGIASETHSHVQIQGDRITGVLIQVPLRRVLDQLHEKLAVEYDVPEKELDKLVSVNLVGETVSNALTKVLSSWDYALRVDQKGRVHQIFVAAKIGPFETRKNAEKTSESQMAIFPRKMMESEPIYKTSNPNILLSRAEIPSQPEKDAISTLNFLGTSEKIRPMVIQSSPRTPMSIQSSSNFMQVIPASGYPPMDILPVSEDALREFIEAHN